MNQWLRRNSLEVQDDGICLLLIGPTLALLFRDYVGALVAGLLVGLGLLGGLLVGVGWFAESASSIHNPTQEEHSK